MLGVHPLGCGRIEARNAWTPNVLVPFRVPTRDPEIAEAFNEPALSRGPFFTSRIRAVRAGWAKYRETMYFGKKIAVVMPAYNAAKTVTQTVDEVLQQGIVDEIILVDDHSRDDTVAVASSLPGVRVHVHERNMGYGGNQKTCYRLALEGGADIVIMIHADYQYTPKLIPAMASIIANGLHPCVLASRILGGYSLRGGMPVWKYVANRFLTLAENILLGAKLSEYHTGYRAFSREILEKLDFESNSNDFVFDNQMLAQILWHGFTIGEVSCPTKYFKEASSINFRRSLKYGFGCLAIGLSYRLAKMGLRRPRLFSAVPRPGATSCG
jgi:glycosyltransferase involved in cell wall biosynthesis